MFAVSFIDNAFFCAQCIHCFLQHLSNIHEVSLKDLGFNQISRKLLFQLLKLRRRVKSFPVFVCIMASGNTPVTPEEYEAAKAVLSRAVLSRARQAGVFSQAGVSSSATGSMSDASKRLRDQWDIFQDEQWEPVSYCEPEKGLVQERFDQSKVSDQKPIPVKTGSPSDKLELPPGISCVADWSSTICRLPKVQKLNMSYAELVASREHQSYLVWVQQHGKGRGGRFEDLSKYLDAIKFADSKGYSKDPQQTFPDSLEKREKK